VRKEGYDIERMMRAAGLEAPVTDSASTASFVPAPTQTQIQSEGPLA